MGPRRDAAGGRAASLEQHEGFALGVRGRGDARELSRILEVLHHRGNDGDFGISREMLDVVLYRGSDLIAAGDEMGEADLAVGDERGEHVGAEPAALGYEREATLPQRPRQRSAEGSKIRAHID